MDRPPSDATRSNVEAAVLLGVYLAVAAIWIRLSDWLLGQVLGLEGNYQDLQHGSFLAVTALLLYVITRHAYLAAERARQDHEQMLRLHHMLEALVDQSPLPILALDREGKVLSWNPAAQQLFGWKADEVLGRLNPVVPPEQAGEFRQLLGWVLQGNTYTDLEVQRQRKDGSLLQINISAAPIRDSQGDVVGVMSILLDQTSRRQSEEELRRQSAGQGILNTLDNGILQRRPLEETLGQICDELAELLGCSVVWVGLKQDDATVAVRAASGPHRQQLQAVTIRWDDTPEGSGPTGLAMRTGLPQVGEYPAYPPGHPFYQLVAEAGMRSYLALPLMADDEVVGSLTLYDTRPQAFDPATIQMLTRFAYQISLSIIADRNQEQILLHTAALEAAANGIVITDCQGTIRWVNPAFSALTGYSREEVLGQKPNLLRSGHHPAAFYHEMWQTILAGGVWRGEMMNRRKDGSVYVEEMTITPVRAGDGSITHFVAVKQDVTERRSHEEQLNYLATHDIVTGLPNRTALRERLEEAVRQSATKGSGVLLLINLDDFKVVNDTLGHLGGDRMLSEVSILMRSALRPKDTLARLSGDEFVAILEESPLETGHLIAQRLQTIVQGHRFHLLGQTVDTTISIGLVPIDPDRTAAEILSLADAAVFAAKGMGKNKIVVYPPVEGEAVHLSESTRWAFRVKEALRTDGFVLHFQPVVELIAGHEEHCEALLRLLDEGGQPVPPARFLPAAERFRLMPEIDRWVLARVLRLLRERPAMRIFMNLSGQSLGDDGQLERLTEMVERAGPAAARLTFEITETVAVRDLNRARSWMDRMLRMGCQFALDDLGIGFSSFAYLGNLPVQFVKIDGSFIRDLDQNLTSQIFVRAMTDVAHSLGKEIIAEWVESEPIARVLREMGVRYGQGYHLGRPGPLQ